MPSRSSTSRAATRVEADLLAVDWEQAFDAAARALDAVRAERVSPTLLDREHRLLAEERQDVGGLLRSLATSRGDPLDGWLPPRLVTPNALGLPAGTKAVVFDLDGVLTDSDRVHAEAWAEALNPVLMEAAHELGWAFVPFDADEEYRLYFDDRPRLEGVQLFLEARGLRSPEIRARATARRKADVLHRRLHHRAPVALPGSHRYVHACAHAGIARAVVSASESTRAMLELARLDHLIDAVVDGDVIRTKALGARPSPDTLLTACMLLGVVPAQTVSLTHSGAGVAAAHAAGLTVRGVARGPQAERLRGLGAAVVVPSLFDLLDHSLRS